MSAPSDCTGVVASCGNPVFISRPSSLCKGDGRCSGGVMCTAVSEGAARFGRSPDCRMPSPDPCTSVVGSGRELASCALSAEARFGSSRSGANRARVFGLPSLADAPSSSRVRMNTVRSPANRLATRRRVPCNVFASACGRLGPADEFGRAGLAKRAAASRMA